jgi:class 3 adenylate cyclase
MEQQIRFCTSADGTRIAFAIYGEQPGTPLVQVSSWTYNEELHREVPEIRALSEGLAQGRQLVLFDRRGVGASQRGVDDLSLEAHVADLTAIVNHLGLEQFDLIGWFDGTAVSVAYAARHPERVSRLVLCTPYPRGEDTATPEAARSVTELIRANWPLARRTLTDIGFPNAPAEMRHGLANALRRAISSEIAAEYVEFVTNLDVTSFLPRVQAPTLVLHPRAPAAVPMSASQAVAALIPDALFIAWEGDPLTNQEQMAELVRQFLDEGRAQPPAPAGPADVATILFTDMESSTALTQRLGDAKAQELVRAHNTIVREALRANGGSEIKHTGDGIMASFATASGALECAVAIQRAVAAHGEEHPQSPLRVRIGLNAGEPIAEEDDLFGTAVQLARRICDRAEPSEILASNVVRELSAGKGFLFADRGETALRGFEDPVRLYEVRWRP